MKMTVECRQIFGVTLKKSVADSCVWREDYWVLTNQIIQQFIVKNC